MDNTTISLRGKIALVTGGSRGIGAAIAFRLASQGATVALSYSASEAKANEVVKKIEAAGGSAIALKADQAIEGEVIGLVSTVVERLGKIDILVNNAGVFEAGTIDETPDTSRFERQVRINYQAVVRRHPRSLAGDGRRRPDHHAVVGSRASFQLARHRRLQRHEARHRGLHQGRGPRPWCQGDYGQRDWNRLDRHRHEPLRWAAG